MSQFHRHMFHISTSHRQIILSVSDANVCNTLSSTMRSTVFLAKKQFALVKNILGIIF